MERQLRYIFLDFKFKSSPGHTTFLMVNTSYWHSKVVNHYSHNGAGDLVELKLSLACRRTLDMCFTRFHMLRYVSDTAVSDTNVQTINSTVTLVILPMPDFVMMNI